MKRNTLTLLTGGVVLLIFVAMLFGYQVRKTESAVVTTFGKYSSTRSEPGLYFRLPWPIQSVHRFDNRTRNFAKKYEQTTTRDGRILMIEVYLGWRVTDPRIFLERFGGDLDRAESNLEILLRAAQNSVVGQHPLSDFISTNADELKFDDIETEMLAAIKPRAAANSGIEVVLLGIKQIGLPESITTKVFERMKAEREQLVKQFQGEGAAEAIRIRSEADYERDKILAEAERRATVIKGQADAASAAALKTFEQDPELAVFLLKLNALEQSLKERATLILDTKTPPFDLLKGQPELPAKTR
ncbi:MAG: protease modulator HflC [Verrucomicrobia bacterium]|nr:protease modulator HflC [Verrucomicrobiota bacterium]